MKRWLIPSLFLLLLFLTWCATHDFVERKLGLWPRIVDSTQLAADCDHLLQAIKPTSPMALPPAQWPASISGLRPRAVTVHPDAVDILISTGGIGAALGYLVIPRDAAASTLQLHFKTRPYKPHIFFWEAQA